MLNINPLVKINGTTINFYIDTKSYEFYSGYPGSVFVSQGSIFLAGSSPGYTGITGIFKINMDGSLDKTFGVGGLAAFRVSADSAIIDSIGVINKSVYVTGSTLSGLGLVAKLNDSGVLDSTFGTNGVAYFDRNSFGRIEGSLFFDNKLFVSNYLNSNNHGISEINLITGQILGVTSPIFTNSYVWNLRSNIDSILAITYDEIYCFTMDRSIKKTFGNNGLVDFSALLGQKDIHIQDAITHSSGNIFVSGTYTYIDSNFFFKDVGWLSKLDRNGVVDKNFGDNGFIRELDINFGSNTNLSINNEYIYISFKKNDLKTTIKSYDVLGNFNSKFSTNGFLEINNAYSMDIESLNNNSFLQFGSTYDGKGLAITSFTAKGEVFQLGQIRSISSSESHTVSVIVDKGVLDIKPVLLKDLVETFTFTDGINTGHTLNYLGTSFNYGDVDSLITMVTRDGEFTDEFRSEISAAYPSFSSIKYAEALSLIGVSNIDQILIQVAGIDGGYVN